MPTPAYRDLGAAIAALAMDEPPADDTIAAASVLAATLEHADEVSGDRSALIDAMVACLRAAAARRALFVDVVPALVAAAHLLERPDATDTSLAGARYDLETLLPVPGADSAPDVPISALRRAKRERD